MNYKMMGRFVAQMLFIETIFMVPALIISACYGEMLSVQGFLLTIAVMLAVEGILWLLCNYQRTEHICTSYRSAEQ